MAHGHPDFQPTSTPTLPDFGEGQVPWFQSENVEVAGPGTEDLINYIVPDGMELRVCSGIVSCEAPRTQRFNFITTPAGDWVSPTSHIDDDGKWGEEEKAYDGNINSAARALEENHYLQLVLSTPTTCNKIRLYATTFNYQEDTYSNPDVSIDIYDGTAWVNIFSGVIAERTWVEKAFAAQLIQKARIKWNSGLGVLIFSDLYEFQFDTTGETPQETIYFDTYAIIPYLPEAPYPVPAGATFTVRVYNDDDVAQKFSVNFAGFLQAKV